MNDKTFDAAKFVDRSIERQTFEALLQASTRSYLPVVSFYGVGGVGKSWLQDYLVDFMETRNKKFSHAKIPFAKMNFQGEAPPENFLEFLFYMACALDEKGAKFPEFWAAWFFHEKKPGVKSLSRERFVPSKNTPWLQTLASMVYGLSVAPWLATFSPEIWAPVLVASGGLVFSFSGKSVEALNKWRVLHPRHRKTYRDKTETELMKALPQAFIRDLGNSSDAPRHGRCNSVLFFDALEAVDTWSSPNTEQEQWIAELARLSPYSLIVLTGHNRLDWTRFSPTGTKSIRVWQQEKCFEGEHLEAWGSNRPWYNVHMVQYKLLDLEKTDALQLLKNYQIEDQELCAVILRECREDARREEPNEEETVNDKVNERYHAESLSICIATIESLRGGLEDPLPTARDFSLDNSNHTSIYERYLKSLPHNEWKWTKRLALTPQFDVEAAEAVCGVNETVLNKVLSRNYVSLLSQVRKEDWYIFNSNMRHHILEVGRPLVEGGTSSTDSLGFDAQAVHEKWYLHWEARRKKEWRRNKDPLHLFAQLSWHHLWHLRPKDAWDEWRKLSQKMDVTSKEKRKLLTWWDMTDLKYRKPRSEFEAEIAFELAGRYFASGTESEARPYFESIELCKRSLQFYDKENYPNQWANAHNRVGSSYARLAQFEKFDDIEIEEFLDKAIASYDLCLNVRNKGAFLLEWSATQYNKGGVCQQIGNLSSINQENRIKYLNMSINYIKNSIEGRSIEPQNIEYYDSMIMLAYSYNSMISESAEETESAYEYLEESIRIFEFIADFYKRNKILSKWARTKRGTSEAYSRFARLFPKNSEQRIANLRKSLLLDSEALKVYENIGDKTNIKMCKISLGDNTHDIYIGECNTSEGRDKLSDVISYYNEALRLCDKSIYPRQWFRLNMNKANVECELEKWSDALLSAESALESYQIVRDEKMRSEFKEFSTYIKSNL